MKFVRPLLLLAATLGIAVHARAQLWDFSNGPPDSLPALTRYEAPVFPASLRTTGVTDGYATLAFTIDDAGQVEDAVGLEASDPAFVDATLDALLSWRFAKTYSPTVPRREVIQFDYRRSGTVASLSQRDASKAAFAAASLSTPLVRTVTWEELKDQPARVKGPMPSYPEQLRSKPVPGHALVDFVIDTEGKVRVPTVTNSSAPEFGHAALAAIKQWRFEPPTVDGRSVNVHVTRSFSFGRARKSEVLPPPDERIVQNP